MTISVGKKVSFGPKNVEKTGFSGFSDITSGKRLANLLYCSDWAQTHRVAAYLIVKGAQIIKMTISVGKKVSFGPKNVEKTGFSGFSDITSGKRLANLLYCSDWAQTYRVAAYLIVKGAQRIKMTTSVEKS